MNPHTPKPIIGWTEYIDFPQWEIVGLEAKVDTGARTSAIHVENLEAISHDRVRFEIMTGRKRPFRRKSVESKILKWARVRSSTGVYTERCFVRAQVKIGPIVKNIEVSLVCRGTMQFRMLLGRTAIEHDFLVDVSKRKAITSRPKKKAASALKPITKPKHPPHSAH
ncbi:MAG: hypothetical protein ACI9VS_003471 [Candidatus Binatia bacterium]|jgi:hypothetical protein